MTTPAEGIDAPEAGGDFQAGVMMKPRSNFKLVKILLRFTEIHCC